MKRCTKCQAEKPLADFVRDKRQAGGFGSWCKACAYEYRRAWAKRNPEAVRASKQRWNRKSGDYFKAYNAEHRERITELDRAWKAANPAKVRSAKKRHYEANRLQWRGYNAIRRARTRGPSVDYEAILERDGYLCHLCGGLVAPADVEFDHVVPLARGGEHTAENIRVTHGVCNRVKGCRSPRTWSGCATTRRARRRSSDAAPRRELLDFLKSA